MADPPVGARLLVPLGNRTLTGVRLGSNRGQTGVRPGSDRGQTGVRPGSDPPQVVDNRPGTAADSAISSISLDFPKGSDPGLTPVEPPFDPGLTPIKEIFAVLDETAFLPPDVVELAAWVADYYACGVGEAIATAMPPRAWIESERHAAITEAGEARLLSARGARRDVLQQLTGGRVVSVTALTKKARARRRSSRHSKRTD